MSDFSVVFPPNSYLNSVYTIGDVFNENIALGVGTIYRAWHLMVTAADMGRREFGVKVVFRHNPTIGAWVLIVNGEIKATGTDKTTYETTSSREFQLVAFNFLGKPFELKCARGGSLQFVYTLTLDGVAVTEIRDKTENSLGEQFPRVTVTDVRTKDVNGKLVAMYHISSQVGSETVTVEKRYSDFELLHNTVIGYTSSHIIATLPSLPGKVLNPFFNQLAPEFLAQRKDLLQFYLNTLLGNSKVALYTELFCFLGLDPITGGPLSSP